MNPAFWSGKKVFLTGHTGFKGSWLSLWLQKLGADLTGYALEPAPTPNLFNIAEVGAGMKCQKADIRDLSFLLNAIRKAQPEIVIHMAAQALVRRSYQVPVETYEINIMGTVNLLEAVRQVDSVRAVIIVTSDKCYENNEWIWGYREDEPMGGFDPYSSSKGCAELVTAAYRNSYFHPDKFQEHHIGLATVRAGNVIGGGDWSEDRLIPDIMRCMMQNNAIKIRLPNSIRPWQHVLEPLSGYLQLAQMLYTDGSNYAGGWNFGPADEDVKPVHWIVDKLIDDWGHTRSWELIENNHLHEAHYLKLDCSKARMSLNWQPKWGLDEALNAIVIWYKAYQSGVNMQDETLRQISQYELQLAK